MPRLGSIAGLAALLCLAGIAPASAQQWQVDAKYCFGDTQAPGQAYRATCKDHDQFDSVLACEKAANDQNAIDRVQMAGRDDVNTFMMGFGPIDGCQ
ncbi:MAG TPA: hypothetical protein VLA85_00795 [Verrucomicrobiae bacterium]|jgi:hypothetical protein|nr:hypothetical protein [Verrucomicrobiae bacterium]